MATTIPNPRYNVSLLKSFLTDEEAAALFERIMSDPTHFKYPKLTKSGAPSKKRNKTIYGGIKEYVYEYRGKSVKTPIRSWSAFLELKDIANRIAKISGQTYKTCVIRIYNSGVVGIKPHTDKEMMLGDIITSVSLGTPPHNVF